MAVPFVPAESIDEVIERLNEIIDLSVQKKSAMGLFPALYIVVTEKIKEGIEKGNVFENNKRMEKLDVIFANRFLEAYHKHLNGQDPGMAWSLNFKAAEGFPIYIILQELLIGTNAHINLDLGIAAAETSPGNELDGLYNDFLAVNKILADLTDVVYKEISHLSPRIGLVDRWLKGADDAILKFSIKEAREEAWDFAEDLAVIQPREWPPLIKKRDQWATKFGQAAMSPGLIGKIIVWWIKRKESKDLPYIIEELRNTARNVAARMG